MIGSVRTRLESLDNLTRAAFNNVLQRIVVVILSLVDWIRWIGNYMGLELRSVLVNQAVTY